MNARLTALAQHLRQAIADFRLPAPSGRALATVAVLGVAGFSTWALVKQPPVTAIEPGAVAVRTNQFTGGSTEFRDGSVFTLPGMHSVRMFTLRDQLYRPLQGRTATGEAPFQSVE